MSVKKGDKVKVEYTGSFDDGTVFDDSKKHGQPIEFEVGSGQVIKGFDDAVLGMNPGQEKQIKIQAKDAYGLPNPQFIKKITRTQLPKDQEPKVGLILLIKIKGQQIPAKIIEVTEKDITVDLNHPLAGKNLNFQIKLL